MINGYLNFQMNLEYLLPILEKDEYIIRVEQKLHY